jgi:hypothetical protein
MQGDRLSLPLSLPMHIYVHSQRLCTNYLFSYLPVFSFIHVDEEVDEIAIDVARERTRQLKLLQKLFPDDNEDTRLGCTTLFVCVF